MSWQDTVMSAEEMAEAIKPRADIEVSIQPIGNYLNIAQAQAEISWKAREPEIAEAHKAGQVEITSVLKELISQAIEEHWDTYHKP